MNLHAAMTSQVVLHAKPELCEACLSCLIACAYAKLGLSEDAPLRPYVLLAARLSVEAASGYSVPVYCTQCANAPCIIVCPTDALQRADPQGPIFAVIARCIGCGCCVLACPTGVLTLDSHNRLVQKCDQCVERVQAGFLPACVESCPTNALELVSLEEATAEAAAACARKAASQLAPRESLPE